MIVRQIAARAAGIRPPLGTGLPFGWQSSRHAAFASAVLEPTDARDDEANHDRLTLAEAPRMKMPAGRHRPPPDASGPAAASSSSFVSFRHQAPLYDEPSSSAKASPTSETETARAPLAPTRKGIRASSASRQMSPRASPRSKPPRASKKGPPTSSPVPRHASDQAQRAELNKQKALRAGRFIQAALSVPVREPKLYVRQLLEHLESDRSLVNPSSVLALEAYALRLNEQKIAKRVRNLALGERMPLPPRPIEREYRIEGVYTNPWMMKKYPPLELLPEDTVSVYAFLRHQHYLLIHAEGYSLRSAVDTLRSMKAGGTAQLAALNMALCYASEPLALLAEAEDLGITYLPRRTVHASVLSLLKRRTRASDVEALLAKFSVQPSPETFCIVAEHALEHADRRLAEYAWTKGKEALAHERLKAEMPQEWGSDPFRKPIGSGDTKTLFRHLGRHLSRWERTMHKMKDRGWATRIKFNGELPPGLPLLAARWVWLPELEAPPAKSEAMPLTGRAGCKAMVGKAERLTKAWEL